MDVRFSLIQELVEFLSPMKCEWFVVGGWAIDLHLKRMTRQRGDLDISVPYCQRRSCLQFFLDQEWQIEGKLGDGFKTLFNLEDYSDEMRYFWSFPRGSDFVRVYVDDKGSRRLAYDRSLQSELDYIEVFFERVEGGQFLYRRDRRVKRPVALAILERDGVKYLAPELVLLYKSKDLSGKNMADFEAIVSFLGGEGRAWLMEALSQVYGKLHPWVGRLNQL
jgi:hypothetical protein